MFELKPFSFSADCKALEQSIKKVSAAVGAQAQFMIGIYKKCVCVIGLSQESFALLSIPNSETASSSGLFSFDSQLLPGLIKGRSIMDFKFDGRECLFKQVKGRYTGKLTPLEVTEDTLTQLSNSVSEKATSASSISADAWSAIKEGISSTAVKDVYQNTTLLSYVSLSGGRLVVSSFDPQHFGLYRLKVEDDGSSFKAALPQTHFNTIEQLTAGSDAKFALTKSRIRATGDGFIVALPATQAEERHFSMVPDFIKALPKPDFECLVEADKLMTISDNLFSLYNSNSNFVFKTKGNLLQLGLSTSSGSASDSLTVETTSKETKFNVDPRLFMDILNLSKSCESLTMRVTDKVVSFSGKLKGALIDIACSRIE